MKVLPRYKKTLHKLLVCFVFSGLLGKMGTTCCHTPRLKETAHMSPVDRFSNHPFSLHCDRFEKDLYPLSAFLKPLYNAVALN